MLQQKQTDALDLMASIALIAEKASVVGHINGIYDLRQRMINIQKLAKIARGLIGEVINAEQLAKDLKE